MNARVEELFHQLADLPREARDRYIAEHEIDGETRRELEALLAFDPEASAQLVRDIGVAAGRALTEVDGRGQCFGPYRLQKLIGRGGMGAVYLAERVDGEVAQRVAIKLLPPGSSGLLRERFLQERQILAALAHPNIARMLDAGHADSGMPFLAMEYVEGRRIDEFSKDLGITQKVSLFLKVCEAVGYLHRNLVVHRDLKPNNILVTAEGEPKLLDFGIAKMLNAATEATMTGTWIATPDYASPEQISGGRITTATDVYSLGAVLYRILCGRLAHEFTDHSPDAIAHVIVAREVARPSRWVPELKGDLESILLKALRKDPQDRYQTVEQFAEDLQAFLGFRPVKARSGNAWYRARKFLRRHWMPAAAAALVVASLATGMEVANRERALAQQRFLEVRQLANKLFDLDLAVRDLPGSTGARQLIVNTSLDYLTRVARNVKGDPELALEVGNAYMRVARVQGVPISANLGQMDEAEKNLRIAEDLVGSVLAVQPGNRTALLRSAQIAHDRMIIARLSDRFTDTLPLAQKAATALERFHAGAADKPEVSAILNTYENVADQFNSEHRPAEALELCRRGIELSRIYASRRYLADFLRVNALVLREQGDLEAALKSVQESVEVIEAASNGNPTPAFNIDLDLVWEGRILAEDNGVSLGRATEAIPSLERAFLLDDEEVHQDSKNQRSRGTLAMAGLTLGNILRHSDRRRALEIYDHTLRHVREIRNNPSFQRFEVSLLAGSSYALVRLGRSAEARKQLDSAFEHLSRLKQYPTKKIKLGNEADQALEALADYEAESGNPARAIATYHELLAGLSAGGAKPEASLKDAVELSNIYQSLASLYRRSGQIDLASEMQSKRVELWRNSDRRLPNNPFVKRQMSASVAP